MKIVVRWIEAAPAWAAQYHADCWHYQNWIVFDHEGIKLNG